MKQHPIAVFIVFLLALALACGGQEVAPTITPAATEALPTETAAPTATNTAVPTTPPTPPPSPTPAPSLTPSPTETPTPAPAADFTSYSDETAGFELGYPADWVTDRIDNDGESILVFASSEEWLDSTGEGTGALLGIIVRPRAQFGEATTEGILAAVVEEFPLAGETEEVEAAAGLAVSDRPAIATVRRSTAEGPDELTALYIVVDNGDQIVLMLGAATSPQFDEYRPILEAIVHSLQLRPAGSGVVPGDLVDYLSYAAPSGIFSLLYPASWQAEPSHQEYSIGVTLASDVSLVDGISEGESGAVLNMAYAPLSELTFTDLTADSVTNLAGLQQTFVDSGATLLEASRPVWYNGVEMARADLTSVGPSRGRVILIWTQTEEIALIAVAVATADVVESQLPVLEVMVNSLLFGVTPVDFAVWDEGEGFTFRYPADWVFDADSSFLLLASSQAILDSVSPAELGEGGGVQFERVQNAPTADPLAALAADLPEFQENFADGTAMEEVQAAHLISLNSQPAAIVTYRAIVDGVPLLLNRVVIINGTSSQFLTTIVLEESATTYQPVINTIINSVTSGD
jgi:hypothetical protein